LASPFADPDLILYPPLKFSLPKAQRFVLENGIIVHLLEDHEIPLVNISVVIRTGSVYDPDGREGLAELTGEVMRTGGTAPLSGNEVDETLEFIGGSLSISVDRDSGSVNLSILKKDMDEGLMILSGILQNPSFEDDKLKLAKALKIEDLKRIGDNPQRLAFREFNRLIFQNNPRGRLPRISSVEKITRDDLILFHKSYFSPRNIMMTITGDIAKDEAVRKIQHYFGAWHVPKTVTDSPPLPIRPEGRIYFLLKDIPQSIIIHGNHAPSKKDADSYAFEVLDFILGSGGFRSRIFQEVRSSLGLAYSAGSFYRSRSEYGIFGAYAITGSESTAVVLSLIRSIIEDAKDNPVSMQELDWAKNSINKSFIFSFLSARQIARQQMMLEYDSLPDDYLITYRDTIQKIFLEDVRFVAKKYLSFDRGVTLVVGNERAYHLLKSEFGEIHTMGGTL
jgi:predicted Zn-dependent peptidase